jgi:hypothetical protein
LFRKLEKNSPDVEVLSSDPIARYGFTDPIPDESFIVVARLSRGINPSESGFQSLVEN